MASLTFIAIGRPLALVVGACPQETGGNRVDVDAERSKFMGQLPCQADQGGLCAGIGLNAGEADAETCSARNEHHLARAAGLHGRNHCAGDQECAANIDVVDAVPVRSRNGLDRFAGLSEDAAGDMHEDVEAVALLFDKPGDGALVGHIKCGDGNRPRLVWQWRFASTARVPPG